MVDAAAFPDPSQMDLAQMMQSLASEDPRMAMLARLMQAQRPEPSNDDVPDERDDLIAELSERLDAAEARLTKMTRIARQLHQANAEANNRLSLLAAALGCSAWLMQLAVTVTRRSRHAMRTRCVTVTATHLSRVRRRRHNG